MIQDYAKKRKTTARPRRRRSGRSLFAIGFLFGTFSTIVLGSWWLNPEDKPASENSAEESESSKPADQRTEILDLDNFSDFFEMFPSAEVPVDEGYGTTEPAPATHYWILQAGSFREQRLAEQRRAELILMDIDAVVRKVEINGTTWHRVEAGPYETQLLKNRAHDRLAEAEIEARPIRIQAGARRN